MAHPPRFAKVPWFNTDRWSEAKDLTPVGDPETVVFLPHGDSLVGLHIVGLSSDVMLGIRENPDGHPLTCAITNEIVIEHAPIHLLSNPIRHLEEGD